MGTTQPVAGDGNSVTLTGARISSDLLEDSDEVLFIAVVSELLSVCMAFSLMLSLTTSKEVTVEVAVLLENEITLHLYVGYRETLSYTCSQTKTMHVSLYFLTYFEDKTKKSLPQVLMSFLLLRFLVTKYILQARILSRSTSRFLFLQGNCFGKITQIHFFNIWATNLCSICIFLKCEYSYQWALNKRVSLGTFV